MTLDRKTVSNELEELGRLSVKSLFYKWKNSHYKQFDPLVLILKNLKTTISTNGSTASSPEEQWYELECVFRDIQNWLDAFDPMVQVGYSEELLLDWSTQFRDYIYAKPEDLRLAYPDGFWHDSVKDGWSVRSIKALRRMLISPAHRSERVKQRERRIRLRDLLHFYVDLPVQRFIEEEKRHYLKRISWKIQNTREKLAQTRDLLVLPLQTGAGRKTGPGTIPRSRLHKLTTGIEELVDSLNSWTEYETQIDERFSASWRSIYQKIDQIWDKAATFQHPNTRYSLPKRMYAARKLENNRLQFDEQWTGFFKALEGSWQKDLELTAMQFRLGQLFMDTSRIIDERLEGKVKPAFSQLNLRLKETAGRIKRKKSPPDLVGFLTEERDKLLNDLRESGLPAVINAIIHAEIRRVLENFQDLVFTAVQNISDRLVVFRSAQSSNEPGSIRIEEIPLRKLVRHEINTRFSGRHRRLSAELQTLTENMLRSISEVDHVLNYHFQDGVNRAEAGESGEALDLVEEGLKWASNLIERLNREVEELKNNAFSGLQQLSFQMIELMELLTREDDLKDHKIQYLRDLRKAARKRFLNNTGKALKKVLSLPVRTGHLVYDKSREFYRFVATDFYKQQERNRRLNELSGFLKESHTDSSHSPYVYSRLFTREPLHDDELFIGRERQLKQLEAFFTEPAGNLAVVGEPGVGKSTFLNIGLKRYARDRCQIHLKPERRMTTAAEFSDFTDHRCNPAGDGEKTFVVLENPQNLFLSCPGGFEAFKELLGRLKSKQEAVCWVVSFPEEAWHLLNRLFHLEAYFNEVLTLRRFNEEELYRIIEKRHSMSGYHIELPDPVVSSTLMQFPDDRYEHPGFYSFMDRLTEFSQGNPSPAIRFWTNCVESVDDDRIRIAYKETPDMTPLEWISAEDRVLMQSILRHGSLSAQEMSRIFRKKEASLGITAGRLAEHGLLIKSEESYAIHPFLVHLKGRY